MEIYLSMEALAQFERGPKNVRATVSRQKAFKWWSNDTVNRTIASLIRQRLIFATDEYNQHEYERTRWFALNPEEFRMLESVGLKRA